MTPDISGPTSAEPFAVYDPESSSWRTCSVMLPLGLTESSPTLPASGSMRNGRLYERPTWVPATAAPDCSLLLLTPTVEDAGRCGSQEWADRWAAGETPTTEQRLRTQVRTLLPTPTTEPMTGNGHARNLGREAKALLPTPRTSDAHGAGAHGTGGPDLRTALLPTPRVAVNRTSWTAAMRPDSRSAPSLEQAIELASGTLPAEFTTTDTLPPSWGGAVTPPPSTDTQPSSDDQPPTLWTNEDD